MGRGNAKQRSTKGTHCVFGLIKCYDEAVVRGADEIELDGGPAAMADREGVALAVTLGSDVDPARKAGAGGA